ncbi:MAG: transposase [Proteobacteria bacterium]|nr:transposase [Pseudomonadota bacterium]
MPKPGPRTTYKYTDDFKATAVKLSYLPGVQVQDVARSLYIHPFMLSRWRKEVREGLIVAKGKDIEKVTATELAELKRLRKENARLEVENDLLKKAIEYTSGRSPTYSSSSDPTKKQSK